MFNMTALDIQKAIGGKLLGGKNVLAHGVCTDSREILPGSLFVAILGDRFDGNNFAEDALERGANIALVSRDIAVSKGQAAVVVENTGRMMLELARNWRRRFDIPVVGITGSAGKTTTKEMLFCALSQKYNTHKTKRNLNNEIGLPITLFNLGEEHTAAVVEMGMSARGEISRLAKAACPTVAVITNIGLNHIEHLKTEENILLAKLEVLDGLDKNGTLILNADDPYLKSVRDTGFKTVFFGIENECEYRAENVSGEYFEIMGRGVRLPVAGKHNIYNALAAIATAHECGVPISDAAAGIENFKTDGIRQSIVTTKEGVHIICDYYNASPHSTSAALEVLSESNGRKIAVLGDMLELGEYAKESHQKIGEMVYSKGIDALVTVGRLSHYTAEAARALGLECIHGFDNNQDAAEYLKGFLKDGDYVLIKGSRGMKMEEIYEEFMG